MAHHYDTVPITLPIALAAKLAGVSRQTFRKLFLDSGRCSVVSNLDAVLGLGDAGQVWRWDLEKALGRALTIEDVQQADKQLDKARQGQRAYRRRQGRKRAA